uniref:Ig-like domain-containing protein n=1 Tax=Esox lucius TaxID=8010 RepID=A0A6Q2X944_ESOLU
IVTLLSLFFNVLRHSTNTTGRLKFYFHVGNVMLHKYYLHLRSSTTKDVSNFVLWLKQTFGQKPLLMASSYHYSQESSYFNNFIKDFNRTKRLRVKRAEDSFNLTFIETEPGDSATYYCAALKINEIIIAEGTVLIVKVQPGESVTLNCTVSTETCEGEHSVYWFRHDSGESPPGIIYTNGDRSGQCMKSPESGSPTQSCVYNLPKRNLSLSDTGTYYCAVASCGEILFGNGTKLDVGVFQLLKQLP